MAPTSTKPQPVENNNTCAEHLHRHHLSHNNSSHSHHQHSSHRARKAPAAAAARQQLKSATGWKVHASDGATNTSNPIREIIETMNLAKNPSKKVIPLSIGDPTIFGNLKPCPQILDALEHANQCGKYYGYQTAAGMESARDAVADYHYKTTGNLVQRQDIILASGCSHAIDLCICVLARSGQNILIPRPGFPLYKTLTSVYGVKYKQYNLLADKNWSIDLEHLESQIDENTAAIVINNPSNPCGSVFSREHLLDILKLAEVHQLPIISDEIYDKFVFSPDDLRSSVSIVHDDNVEDKPELAPFDNGDRQMNGENQRPSNGWNNTNDDELESDSIQLQEYVPFISLSSLSETVPILTCGGISKTCLIPGLRLGWIIINDKQNIFDVSIRNGLSRLTQRLMGPNSLVQGALSDILNNVDDQFYRRTMNFICRNAKLCYNRLKLVPGLQPFMPQGSMYLMVRFEEKSFSDISGDLDFTSKLMNEESVLVLPGSCFDFPNYFRICLTVPTKTMRDALNRISEFCMRHFNESNYKEMDDVDIESELKLDSIDELKHSNSKFRKKYAHLNYDSNHHKLIKIQQTNNHLNQPQLRLSTK